MATYTNLTSLQGLKPGDIVNYTVTTAFDTKGYKFKVELYGKKVNNSNGGLTKLTIDSSLLPTKILSYNSRGDLIYGNTTDLYYRIAVAGDAGGKATSYGSSYNGGVGGGNTGGYGGGSTSYGGLRGQPGSQTSGGKYAGNNSYVLGKEGGFGTTPTISSNTYTGAGGYGWYSGSTGYYYYYNGSYSYGAAGGGGSGFIIGVSTTKYPTGYLGNDTDLRNTLTQSISEGSLTQGGSTSYTAKMVITIVSAPTGTSTQSVLNYYNGNEFINTNAKYYDGTQFIDCDVYRYNGTEFIKI